MSAEECRVCGSQGPFTAHRAKEMLYGTREEFDYIECTSCGSLQIRAIPDFETLARHYPDNYYSFNATTGAVKRWAETQRDKQVTGRRTPWGALAAKRRPDTTLPLLTEAGLRPEQRIVDVGCGRGHLLDRLARLGFTNLLGVDPFIDADTRTPAGVDIKKVTLEDVEGEFDVVMFHHSLEHVPDPTADLAAARSRLRPGGRVIVRIPTTSSEGWDEHGVHWSSLDPPRHLVLPSREGMTAMATKAGLELIDTVDDSYGGQYANSVLYSRDISASDPEAVGAFTDAEMAEFQAFAEDANRRGRADQAMFVFRAVDDAR